MSRTNSSFHDLFESWWNTSTNEESAHSVLRTGQSAFGILGSKWTVATRIKSVTGCLSIDNAESFHRNPDRMDDIQILGTAVFSRCRNIMRRSMGGCVRELEWLHLALKRLEELAEEKAGSHTM